MTPMLYTERDHYANLGPVGKRLHMAFREWGMDHPLIWRTYRRTWGKSLLKAEIVLAGLCLSIVLWAIYVAVVVSL